MSFSFYSLKSEAAHPAISQPLHDVVSAEALDPETVRYTFKGTLTRDLPIIVAQLPVLSKAYYTTQPFDETSLKPPLGSGPYKIKDFNPGTYITYTRRDDYWAKDLPVNRGRYNFDEIRYDYYRDRNIELEAIKSGQLDFREEFSSVSWATGYDIAAVHEGRLIKAQLPDNRPSGAQGFFINTRRDKFKDPRVRLALDLVFDFEWSNKKLFYGLYTRTTSYFENSDMKASGMPSPEELALLDPYKDKLSPEVFGEPYTPPVTDGSGNNRDNLKKARDLLIAAGWKPGPDHMLHNAKGETADDRIPRFRVALFERITRSLHGEPEAHRRRCFVASRRSQRSTSGASKSFDFDVTTQRYSLRLTPGVEMRSYWGSEAAKMDGSFNLAGISRSGRRCADRQGDRRQNPEPSSSPRRAPSTACFAPGTIGCHTGIRRRYSIAYWNKYSRPAVQPKYDAGVLDTWWFDSKKAEALSSGKPQVQSQEQQAKP